MIQSLFFCLWGSGQTLEILHPKPGDAVENDQPFEIRCTGEMPSRVQFLLNDQVIAERRQGPYHFLITWNTALENSVRIRAVYADGLAREVSANYPPIKVDVVAESKALQCFPFSDRLWQPGPISVKSRNGVGQIEVFESAQAIPCELTLLLDVSGSMLWEWEGLAENLKDFVRRQIAQGHRVSLNVFDAFPRRIPIENLWELKTVRDWYQLENRSAVWDALAASLFQIGPSPRRVVLLLSDGADDASKHSFESIKGLLREKQAILCWGNPTHLRNRELVKLVRLSGGLTLNSPFGPTFESFETLLQHQMHLVVAEAHFPIHIESPQASFTYPHWEAP